MGDEIFRNIEKMHSVEIIKPKVSVIIPCFNDEKYLFKTINSLLSQSFTDWECILINDGSTDGTEGIIQQAKKLDNRLKYIYQKNAGVCVARNNAIKASIGEYILCLDANDLISKNFLDETVKVLDSDPALAVATSKIQFFGKSNSILKVVSYDIDILLAENQLVITSLFRRSDFDRIGGFNTNMKEGYEDWDFWISLLKDGGLVKCADQATFYYRLLNQSRNSLTTLERERRLRYQMWENHKELYSRYFIDPTSYSEYKRHANSHEYRVGKIILTPIRKTIWFITLIKEKLNIR